MSILSLFDRLSLAMRSDSYQEQVKECRNKILSNFAIKTNFIESPSQYRDKLVREIIPDSGKQNYVAVIIAFLQSLKFRGVSRSEQDNLKALRDQLVIDLTDLRGIVDQQVSMVVSGRVSESNMATFRNLVSVESNRLGAGVTRFAESNAFALESPATPVVAPVEGFSEGQAVAQESIVPSSVQDYQAVVSSESDYTWWVVVILVVIFLIFLGSGKF